MFLVKSGCHYVKAIDGRPCCRSTQDLREAARFASEEAAREFAPNVFAKSMLAAVEIVPEGSTGTRPVQARPTRLTKDERFNEDPNMPWDHYMG